MGTFLRTGLTYLVPPTARNEAGIRHFLAEHPEIRFVSLVAVDLGGNDTDEKIPVATFLRDAPGFLTGAIQTDGSSVVLPGIATLNDGKVDFITDPSVSWYIDYNWDLEDPVTGLPVGTLRIPSFLLHAGRRVDSRSVLMRATSVLGEKVRRLLFAWPEFTAELGFAPDDVVEVIPTAATELEFWVRTPGGSVGVDELAVSQALQEQYWKRTKGPVRAALETSLLLLEEYGLAPEMGHKEVGGVKARLREEGRFGDVMEQLEIDWRYATPLQAADNELLARIIIKEVFRRYGLEVTFMAKPIPGVAGSGEHTHVGLAIRLRDGRTVNLFAPADPYRHYLSPLGWGALFGLLKHWPTLAALVTATNDAFNRLQPGFEAPVCPVAAIGPTVSRVTRNRTVLICLVRDPERPAGTRFEVRAPHPHTNTYLALAGFFQAMLDGMEYVVRTRKKEEELLTEFNKAAGQPADYLPTERAYRSEEDVFDAYGEEERFRLFGRPPATVWETLQALAPDAPGRSLLEAEGVFLPEVIDGYVAAMLARWRLELRERLLPAWLAQVRGCVPRHEVGDALGTAAWEKIDRIRRAIVANSYFDRLREALERGDDRTASELQREVTPAMMSLQREYHHYRRWYGT
ncbi:MAG: glutamine synthetase [Firmicutes bacterium]|nr:glutamine synthetase [Bacillota bacterium]